MQFCCPERLRDGERCIHTFLCCLQFPLLGATPTASRRHHPTQTIMLNSEWLQATNPYLGFHMLRLELSGFGFHTWQCHSAGFSLHSWSTCSFTRPLSVHRLHVSFGNPNHPSSVLSLFYLLCFVAWEFWRAACGEVQASGGRHTQERKIRTIQIETTTDRVDQRRTELAAWHIPCFWQRWRSLQYG